MEPLTNPLNTSELEFRIRMVQCTIEKLERAILEQEQIDIINEICEESETSLKTLSLYSPKSGKEDQEQKKAINQFTLLFERLVSSIQSSMKSTNIPKYQTYESFNDLEDHLIRHSVEETKEVQKKMIIVSEIMRDCAEVVQTQGSQLDRIDLEVQSSKTKTEKGVIELEITDVRQRRKKTCCWIILVVALGFSVAIVVVAVMITKN
ncbi:hypothetical protein SteCoe_36564 [Stentor coeruleus]|uniref:t-SNARE coiled-coil homology domain-containing protein n=1 Tax=Stentor coeruleus TaxID=5963 RepID=A0A1R2APY5_9CILI|nr:hypothetical protein SteCoe_36564 [Stentor coeruleus]